MEEKYRNLLQKADAWIEAHKEEFITELRGMVQIPSVSRADLAEPGAPFGPDCRKMLDYSLERGRAYGFDTADHDGFAGSVYMGDPEDSLGIIAHMDVVPVGDGWIYPPFEGTYVPEQDVMIGRGVGDNKGPAVAGLFAMRMLREFG
ncbi:MAG: M20/M25/M40 family metallo-hydrolase [Clostridia bacterium]|nr:M20/M25/M40 family metallo-hydrolase [Clostridia bacterium]